MKKVSRLSIHSSLFIHSLVIQLLFSLSPSMFSTCGLIMTGLLGELSIFSFLQLLDWRPSLVLDFLGTLQLQRLFLFLFLVVIFLFFYFIICYLLCVLIFFKKHFHQSILTLKIFNLFNNYFYNLKL